MVVSNKANKKLHADIIRCSSLNNIKIRASMRLFKISIITLILLGDTAYANSINGAISAVDKESVSVFLRAVDGKDIPGVERFYRAKKHSFLSFGSHQITFLCVTGDDTPRKIYGATVVEVQAQGDSFYLTGTISEDGESCIANVVKESRVRPAVKL